MRKFRLTPLTLLLLVAAIVGAGATPTLAGSGLVSNIDAQRSGLERAWFSQAQLDRSRHRVEQVVLDGNQLFVLTTAGVLHAMDAETGRTDWVTRVGNPDYPSLGPAVNDQYVALVNGSKVTVLNREDGLEHLSRALGGGAGGGPALSEEFVYIPLFSGKMEAYELEEEKATPWYYASAGRVFQPATATTASIAWPTQRGYLYVANPGADGVRYRFEATGLVNSHPVAFDGNLYLSTSNGYVYALNEATGQQKWRYSSGSSITRSPAVVGGKLFVPTDAPALHAVSATTGQRLWQTGGIEQLAGVSGSRVYGMTRHGDLVTMDLESGVPLGTLRTSPETWAVVNPETDRIYLVNETGLVQCLHEIGADKPLMHSGELPADAPAEKPPADAAEAADDQPAQQPDEPEDEPGVVNPFGADDPAPNPFDTPAGGEVNPFDTPADGGANPFDF